MPLCTMSTVVAPFFRASLTIGRAERAVFARGLPERAFVEGVRRLDPVLRQDLRRLFAAAHLAEARRARLALVEGWRSNLVIGVRRRRFVTGSWMSELLLRLLERRRLVRLVERPLRADLSRCTSEEAEAIA